MSDDDIDTRLREHGATWRDANGMRPGVDWDGIARSSRGRAWLAVAAVAATAAAIIVPFAVMGGAQSVAPPRPVQRPSTSPAPHRQLAAPSQMFGIVPRGIEAVGGGRTWVSSKTRAPVSAVGVDPGDTIAYSTSTVGPCRTAVQSTYFPPPSTGGNGILDSGISKTIATVDVGQDGRSLSPTPIAVSPDGSEIAFGSNRVRDATGECVVGERLVVLDTRTRRIRMWTAPRQDALRNLAWSPNGHDLAYLLADTCAFLSFSSTSCDTSSAGTRVLDANAPGSALGAPPLLLGAFGSRGGYGPAYWWHGSLATTFNGSLRQLGGHGGLGKILATGFPQVVDSISSDPSGEHLLIGSQSKTYRWDSGRLTRVPGQWDQPSW